MADGLVRVRERFGGRTEVVKVSAHEVREFLERHPGAQVLDADWQEQAVRVARGEARAEAKAEK